MVACIIAAIVLGVLSIFGAKYRKWAKDAFHCVFRMTTLRKCDTEFDKKLKAAIIGKLMNRNAKLAGFVYRKFELLSLIFTVAFFISLAYTGYSIYNLANYGSCDPGGTCVIVQHNGESGQCVQANELIESEYFDNSAPVLYFYQDGCPWCAKEADVLKELAKNGYKVKPMHLNSNPGWWEEYNIRLTPTFIGPDGKRMVGYHGADELKAFLDNYK